MLRIIYNSQFILNNIITDNVKFISEWIAYKSQM